MTHSYFFPVRSDPHRAFSVEEKCSQAVGLAFCYKRRELYYSQAVQEAVQPGCTRRSAARLYKTQEEVRPGCTTGSAGRLYKKCRQAVQEEVQPDCTNKRKCSQAVQKEVQAGCSVV